MTEIPDHLLKRSKERRAALGLPGGEGGDQGSEASPPGDDVAPAAAAPAPAAAAPAPAQVEQKPPPPPKPKAAYVQAAERRQRIPYWAMPVVALMPVWALLYFNSVSDPGEQDEAIVLGEEVYGACAGCHLPGGQGGIGAPLNEGEAVATFGDPVAMMQWIYLGAEGWTDSTGDGPYGDPDREGGPHDTGELPSKMPAFGDLSPEELAAVTRYVREEIGGEAPASDEVQEMYQVWAEDAIEMADDDEIFYRNADPGDEGQERIDLLAEAEG